MVLPILYSCQKDPVDVLKNKVKHIYDNSHGDLLKLDHFEKVNGRQGKGIDGVDRYEIEYNAVFKNVRKGVIKVDEYEWYVRGYRSLENLKDYSEQYLSAYELIDKDSIQISDVVELDGFIVGRYLNQQDSKLIIFKEIDINTEFEENRTATLEMTDNGWVIN